MPTPTPQVNLYDNAYAHFADNAMADVRRDTYGEDIGQSSWTTADEYRTFIAALNLPPASTVPPTVLDLGCGSGGPALFLAQETNCSVVGADINAEGIASPTADHIRARGASPGPANHPQPATPDEPPQAHDLSIHSSFPSAPLPG